MKQSYAELISELLTLLGEEEKAACQKIIDCLTELGYVPQKQKVQCYIVSFKNNSVNQTIAKIGVRSGRIKGAFYSIKFYACKNPPQKFLNAVQAAILKSNKQYKCCDCGFCGADKKIRGYRYTYPDGGEFIRCGAYVVEISDLIRDDVNDFCNLLREQHEYFLARNNKQATVHQMNA